MAGTLPTAPSGGGYLGWPYGMNVTPAESKIRSACSLESGTVRISVTAIVPGTCISIPVSPGYFSKVGTRLVIVEMR